MNLPALAIEKRAITYFATFLLVAAGIGSYTQLGQLEDPEYSVKTAAIITSYPGASAEQVELEVTDLLETKIQEMVEIKRMYSISQPGRSLIKIDIKDENWSDKLPQIWDVVRKKVRDVQGQLPPGAGEPQVSDDYGYVFGFLMALTTDGYTDAELEEYAKALRKELRVVEGVARVDFWGVQKRQIFIEVSEAQLSELGLTVDDLERTLQVQNMVVDAGSVDHQTQRFRVAPTGEFTSPEEIGNLAVTGMTIQNVVEGARPDELIRIRDFAEVTEGYADPPQTLLRFTDRSGSRKALGIAVAPLPGVNVVQMGRNVDARLDELAALFPVGIDVERISWQSDMVADSIRAFMINLAEAVAIVLVVLALTMGVRMGVIIGLSGLVLAILGTFIVMLMMKIDLQRVSLGALIIAMGMMVDNAIVVADGIMVRIQQGMDRTKAAIESAQGPSLPLLGSTIVAAMAFFPIYASPVSTGEYAGSLFTVVAIALLFSWLSSQTLTPLMCIAWLPEPKQGSEDSDPYGGKLFGAFRGLLGVAIRRRFLFFAGMVALLTASTWGFRFVPKMFFPDSSRSQIMIDYWADEGTRIEQVAGDVEAIESKLVGMPEVVNVSSFIGQGPPRFYLPVSPEDPYSSYVQLIVNVTTLKDVDVLMDRIRPFLDETFPQSRMVRARKYPVGQFNDWQFEARFSGPANADPAVLRDLAEQGMQILRESQQAKEIRTNWRQRVRKLVPEYNQERGRWSGVSRDDLADATKRRYDGRVVGQYREEDDLIPIVLRNVESERETAAARLESVQVTPTMSRETVPLSQVTDGLDIVWEDQNIWRWNRRRAITVQCSPRGGTAGTLRSAVLKDFEAIPLPAGYTLEWKGEYDSSRESQEALLPGMVPTIVIMAIIIVALFNAFRPPIIILLVIPFVAIGITFGLFVTRAPFGFIALLGAMSLSGMMIKNAVVLLDQINVNLAEGIAPYTAVVEAAVSRLRPVVNAAATTVLGMAPLLQDVFWVSMAVTIMFGLAFGTVLTMVLLPTLYCTFYRISAPAK